MRVFKATIVLLVLMAFALCAVAFAADKPPDDADKKGEAKKKLEKVDKPAMSNLPLNFNGRNGLIFTSSTHVLEYKDVEPGFGYMYEASDDPEYESHVMALNLAVGLPKNVMLYGHMPYTLTDLHYGEQYNVLGQKVRSFSQEKKDGIGSIEGGFTWAFFMQDRFLPGMAAGLSFMAPSGDYTQRLSEVKHYGFKVNLAMSLEVFDLFFTDYAFAIFLDGSLVFRDLGVSGREYEEKHGLIHGGLIFPVAPRNFVNLILEYDGVLLKGTTNEDDQNGLVSGLRFITNQVGVTVGYEYMFRKATDMGDAWRIVTMASYRFW